MLTLKQSRRLNTPVVGLFAWAVALLLFFPIFWMLLTSLKTEIDAFATPPQFIFTPTTKTTSTSVTAAATSSTPGTR